MWLHCHWWNSLMSVENFMKFASSMSNYHGVYGTRYYGCHTRALRYPTPTVPGGTYIPYLVDALCIKQAYAEASTNVVPSCKFSFNQFLLNKYLLAMELGILSILTVEILVVCIHLQTPCFSHTFHVYRNLRFMVVWGTILHPQFHVITDFILINIFLV